jgi:PAS domain-containing protein
MRRLTGEEIWMEAVLTTIELGGPTPLVHIVWRDITTACMAREELKNSQERLQMALEAAESGVWMWDVVANQLHWDVSAQAVFGVPCRPEPVPFDVLRDKVHPDDLPAVSAGLRHAFATHTPFVLEYRIWLARRPGALRGSPGQGPLR